MVEQYKGHSPLIPFEERKQIVESIVHVDQVVIQEHRDKLRALEIVKFDIWAIGDDWHGNDYYVEISKRFSVLGVETAWIQYTRGISSTKIRRLLKDRK